MNVSNFGQMDFCKQAQSLSKVLDKSPGYPDSQNKLSSESQRNRKGITALVGAEATASIRSHKDMVHSPKTEFSDDENRSRSPNSNKSINRTPITIDLTKIDFPKVKFDKNSDISNKSKSDQMLSDSFLNTSNVRAHLIEPLFGVDFQHFRMQSDPKIAQGEKKDMKDAQCQTELNLSYSLYEDSSRILEPENKDSSKLSIGQDKDSFTLI